MDRKLLFQACTKFLAGVILVGLLLFLPAGTLGFPNAWRLMVLLFVPMFCAGLVLWRKAPELLRKRLDAKEKQAAQKAVIGLSGLMFLVGFSLVLFLIGYLLFAEVLRENAYLSRTVKVQKGQQLVDTGLYGIVRHPMYLASLLLFLTMPVILDSWVSFIVFLVYPLLIVHRIKNEETVLLAGLPGYADYCERVKYRLVPLIW